MAELARSDRAIERVAPGEKRRAYSIKGAKGLRLVVHPTGRKVWHMQWRDGAKMRWKEIGLYAAEEPGWTLDKACDEARKFLGSVSLGVDPTAPTTFQELYDLWMTEHAKKNLSTWSTEERRYRLHLKTPLGARKISEIERKDVREIRDNVLDGSGPIESNRVVALFNRILNWAVDEDRAKFNPAARLKKVGKEQRRENVLEPNQLAALWHELDKPLVVDKAEGGINDSDLRAAIAVRRAIKLLILTGQRRGEVIGIAKSELDLAEKWWTIPGARTKNGLPHRVPLTKQAIALLREATEASGDSDYVFPSHKTEASLRADAVTKQLHRLCARMEPKIEGIGPHDIRRTIGTTLRSLKVSVEDRSYLFNHISGAKSKVTSWNYDAGEHDAEKERAINTWISYLGNLVNNQGTMGKVVNLSGK